MSRDRHADRLHARLAGGAELTADERRHVATCTDCQRAVADIGRLDDELRAAAAGLATEPIPDADLEPLPAPGASWTTPIPVVVAVGLIAIVIGFALGELRPPTGTDATPTPHAVAERSGSPAPSASVAPVPSPTPPLPGPDWLPLATGGQPCADGEMGFSIVVPEGWYANLHQGALYTNLREGNLMACAFLAPQPFDPLIAGSDPEFDAPIRLTTSVDATPPGTVVEEIGGEWTVERAGETWLVQVVELLATLGDEPVYLHLATRADDQAATEALEAVRDRLTVLNPLLADAEAAEEADTAFADTDVCSDLVRGVNVFMPDAWWTNTVLGDLLPCTYFAPAAFEVGEAGTVPTGVAITLEVVTGNVATIEEILGFETLVVDRHAASRYELTPGLGDPPPDTRTYHYEVALDDTPNDGPSLVLTLRSERSEDYERDKAILDQMMVRLIISPTPPSVRNPLPSCGWELVERTPQGDLYDVDARDCLWDAYEAGEQAEMVSTSPTVEGGILRQVYRILGLDEIEVISDWTHDPLGQGGWQLMRCTVLERQGEDELTGAILFAPASCDTPDELDP